MPPSLIGWEKYYDDGSHDEPATFDITSGVFSTSLASDLVVVSVVVKIAGTTAPTVEMGNFTIDGFVPNDEWETTGSVIEAVGLNSYYVEVFYGLRSDITVAGGPNATVYVHTVGGNAYNVLTSVWRDAASVSNLLPVDPAAPPEFDAPSLDAGSVVHSQISQAFGQAGGSIANGWSFIFSPDPEDSAVWENNEFTASYHGGFVACQNSFALTFSGVHASFSGVAFTYAVGAFVEAPPPPPVVFVPSPRIVGKGWQYILCHTPDPTDPVGDLDEIGELESARGKTLELVRNRAGSAGCSISMYDDFAGEIIDRLGSQGDIRGTLRKTLLVRRDNIDIWSGPIATISGSMTEGQSALTLGAVGWTEYLFHRELEALKVYTTTPQDEIAYDLIAIANAQEPEHPLPIFPGSVFGLMPARSITYQKGENFGASIQKISDVESGFDFDVHPRTRELNIYAWDNYDIRTNVKFGLNWGPENISKLEWAENGLATRNRFIISGNTGVPISAQDIDSQDDYGIFVETINLPGGSFGILPAYANAELALRSRPQVTYTISLKQPTEEDDGAPRLFEDFFVGDQVTFTAHDGPFKINDQAIRIFGVNLTISDDGNQEIVNSLMTNPAS